MAKVVVPDAARVSGAGPERAVAQASGAALALAVVPVWGAGPASAVALVLAVARVLDAVQASGVGPERVAQGAVEAPGLAVSAQAAAQIPAVTRRVRQVAVRGPLAMPLARSKPTHGPQGFRPPSSAAPAVLAAVPSGPTRRRTAGRAPK